MYISSCLFIASKNLSSKPLVPLAIEQHKLLRSTNWGFQIVSKWKNTSVMTIVEVYKWSDQVMAIKIIKLSLSENCFCLQLILCHHLQRTFLHD